MKKIYLLFCITLLSNKGFSQFDLVPTIGQINNYAIGDTFEWHRYSTEGPDELYWMDIVLARTDYGHDSIVYLESSYTNNGSFGEASVSVLSIDSAYYYLYAPPGESFIYDSSAASTTNGDTIYKTWLHFYTDLSCVQENDSDLVNEFAECKLGIGGIYNSYNVNDCGITYYVLIYYHKANGIQGGTPYDFTSGISDLTLANVKIIPNPASTSFQLQFSDYPLSQTYLLIMDDLGRTVKEQEIHSSTTNISRESLSNGIYFWQIKDTNKILARGKLMLQ